ncbi:8786_t:CDS:1 [Funneliformis geosporum]|nr:8786_t:CDS:1 [Funneliformis geosporum]
MHIRFFEIPSRDFYNKIWPFKKILSQELVEEILSFHMTNAQPIPKITPRHGRINVNSTIINSKHTAIINNWIQKKDANANIHNDSRYDFKLIYRASRDGSEITPVTCSCRLGNKATVLIIKIRDDETILGGYNPIGWKHNNCLYDPWVNTNESFIFSFKRDLKDTKLSRVLSCVKAIYDTNNSSRLNFGNSDLVINYINKSGTCKKKNYEISIFDREYFMFDEMEIFRIFKSK